MMSAVEILSHFEQVRRVGNEWTARCPAHDDRKPSLSIRDEGGKILLYCHAGCAVERVLGAAGLKMADLFDDSLEPPITATYPYCDEHGTLLCEVVRYAPKNFKQRRPDGKGGWILNLNGVRRVLYRLPDVLQANSVLICEGEKDCDNAVSKLRLTATTNAGGCKSKWLDEYSESLRGKRVAIIADADEPGRKHAQQVAACLSGKVESLKLLELPGAKDLSEWIDGGGTREVLVEFIREAPQWKSSQYGQRGDREKKHGAVTRCFAAIAPESLQWLWPGRIPLGKVTLLIGDPGLGKSLLTLDLAARVSHGLGFVDGGKCERGGVLLLSAEDDAADTIRPRLDAAGADISRVHILEAVRVQLDDNAVAERGFTLEADIHALEDALTQIPHVRLIIVDPLSAYLGGTDSHVNSEVRGILAPLASFAARREVAILAVSHLRKSPGAAVHRTVGSIAFTAAARAVWAVGPDPGDPARRVMVPVKQNLAGNIGGLGFRIEALDGVPRLAWEPGAVSFEADEVLGFDERDDRSARREAESWLGELLADGPASVKKIQKEARAAGLSWMTVRRAKGTLGILSRKDSFGGGWLWRLRGGQDVQQLSKVLTPNGRASSTELSTFEEGDL